MGLLTLCSERGAHSKGCLDWNSVRSGILSGRCVVNDLPKGADAEICRADAVDAGETRRRTVGNNSDKDMVEESRVIGGLSLPLLAQGPPPGLGVLAWTGLQAGPVQVQGLPKHARTC